MIQELFNERVRKFISDNEFTDPFSLSLKYKEFEGVEVSILIDQIKGRSIAKKKLPFWHENEEIIYPPKISMEQCSSEETALYKAKLFSGESVIDLTGGAGVDLYFFSKNFYTAYYVERNKDLAEVSKHNFDVLKAKNIECFHDTGESFLSSFSRQSDLIYIDPARRADSGKKVFKFEDCEPNVVALLPELLLKGKQILIKASPMLDIAAAIRELKFVCEVHVVSVDNECKELLFILRPDGSSPIINAVNIKKNGESENFRFQPEQEVTLEIDQYSRPQNYLYEPNASILKAGAFKTLTHHFNVMKLHTNTHLYTSSELVADFPGRIFKVGQIVKYNKKDMAKVLPDRKANIAVRNFPEDVSQIRKRMRIKDGGEIYLFACTAFENEKMIIITKKL